MTSELQGWDAISQAVQRAYPDQHPAPGWGVMIGWRLGGNDPLYRVDVLQSVDPEPHWLYVSYGLSEIFDERVDEESGWGLELTLRLADPAAAEPYTGHVRAPQWPVVMLQSCARYVFGTGNVLLPGDHRSFDPPGPYAQGGETLLSASLFTEDPEFGTIQTPNGTVRFTQVLGITDDDLQAAQKWNKTGFIDLLTKRYPKGITHLDARPITDDPAAAQAIQDGIARDGSSFGVRFDPELEVVDGSPIRLRMRTESMNALLNALTTRLPYGKGFRIANGRRGIGIAPTCIRPNDGGPGMEVNRGEDHLTVVMWLDAEQAHHMGNNWHTTPGTYWYRNELEIEVLPS